MKCARVVVITVPRKSEGAGKAGCLMHPQPRVQNDKKHTSQSPQVHRNNPAFPAQWFTAYTELSPVTGLSCHRRGADCSAPLDASVGAPGPHGFAVRVGVGRRSTPQRPSHPAPDVRDDHDTPLYVSAGRPAYKSDLGKTGSGIFLQPGLDSFPLICPSGPVIPGRAEREPGIHNHRCLISTARRPQLRATSTFVVMDSGPAPSGASRNDGTRIARGAIRAANSHRHASQRVARMRAPLARNDG
jgi:hypothetical protein